MLTPACLRFFLLVTTPLGLLSRTGANSAADVFNESAQAYVCQTRTAQAVYLTPLPLPCEHLTMNLQLRHARSPYAARRYS